MAKNKPRGSNLDERLKLELERMLSDGYNLSPISRSALQNRLGLKSRGTLAIKHRAEVIENVRLQQLQASGLNSNGKKRRNTLEEQNEILLGRFRILEQERDALVEKFAQIINGIQAKGYDLEELMMPLRKNFRY